MSLLSRRCVAVVLLVVATAACASKQPGTSRVTTDTSASAVQSGSPRSSGGAHSASGSPRAATAAPTLPPPPKGAPSTPPAEGTYTYAQQGSANAGAFTLPAEPEGTLVVDRAAAASGGMRQKQTRHFSSSRTRAQILIFTSSAMLLEETTTTFGAQTMSCHPDHALTLIKLPLSIDAQWKDSGTCEAGSVSFTAKVLRKEVRTVGGVSVAVFVVRHAFHISSGRDAQDVRIDSWVSPDYRLAIHSVEHATGTIQGAAFTEDMTEDLKSLTPRR